MTTDIGEDAPAPRLCHITKWPDFDGYGFNLQSDKARNGQFIGKVDTNSPSEAAGLKQGDRIVEVNGVNIANENHKQIVERIKAFPQETRLLVVDPTADAWYRNNKVVVRGTQKNVIYLQNPIAFRFSNEVTAALDDIPSHQESDNQPHSLIAGIDQPIIQPSHDTETVDRRSSFEQALPSGNESKDNSAEELPYSLSNRTEQERKTSVKEEPILRHSVDRPDLYFPPPPPLENNNTSDKSHHHEEKRASITFTEHAPVAAIQTTLEHGDSHYHENSDQHGDLSEKDHEKHLERKDSSRSDHTSDTAMQHTYQETVVTHDTESTRDELASQLTGFKILGEDSSDPAGQHEKRHSILADPVHHERRSSNASQNHVHFEHGSFPLTGGTVPTFVEVDISQVPKVYEVTPSNEGKEYIEERVVHSPAFPPPKSVSPREELTETVEVHHNNGYQKPIIAYSERVRKDSASEDSGSRSLSSAAENHSDKENGLHSRNGDIISYDDSKTPSPTPAVIVPEVTKPVPNGNTKVRSVEHGKSVPAPRPAPTGHGQPSLYQSVEEFRASLARKPKKDIRSQPMDLKKKHDIINNL